MFDPITNRHEIRTVVTPWRSLMNGIINLFIIGIAVNATFGTWTFGLIAACVLFRLTLIGYVTPVEYFRNVMDSVPDLPDFSGDLEETELDLPKQEELN